MSRVFEGLSAFPSDKETFRSETSYQFAGFVTLWLFFVGRNKAFVQGIYVVSWIKSARQKHPNRSLIWGWKI